MKYCDVSHQKSNTMSLSYSVKPAFLWENTKQLLQCPAYIIPVIFVAIASYGFFLSHPVISIDDLSYDRYYYGELFAQGRITGTLLAHFLGFSESIYHVWTIDFLGILLFTASGVLLSALFMEYTNTEESPLPFSIFTCLYISNPLTSEIFGYLGTTIAIGGGMIFITLALYFITLSSAVVSVRQYSYTIFLLVAVSSWYESILAAFVCIVFILLFLSYTEKRTIGNWSQILRTGLRFAIPLAVAVLIEWVLSNLVIFSIGIDKSVNAANQIQYSGTDFFPTLLRVSIRLIRDYIAMGFWYFPVTMLVIALFVSAGIGIQECIRCKSSIPFLLFGGMFLSLILISLMQGRSAGYRTCQSWYIFIAFIGMLCVKRISRKRRFITTVVLSILVLWQINDLNRWFTLDYYRSEEEKFVVQQVGLELERNYDTSKPVVFIGDYTLSKHLLDASMIHTDDWRYRIIDRFYPLGSHPIGNDYWSRIQQTNVKSYLSWGVDAFQEFNTELLKYLSFWGFDLKQGTQEMYQEAMSQLEVMVEWPMKGSIIDNGEFIIVKLGREIEE